MESARYINRNIPLSPDTQKDSSSQQALMRLACENGSRFLSIIQKAFIANPRQQRQVSRRKQPKTFKHTPVCHTRPMEPG